MKKNFLGGKMLSLILSAMALTTFTACNDDENTPEPETDGGLKVITEIVTDGNVIGNGDQEVVFKGKQTIAKGTYVLKGWVYVADGSELTIEPGTVIRGDKQTKAALIVERGGKIFAEGTANEPIVFTSNEAAGQRRPGDWGGLILCGNAVNNQREQQIEGGPRSFHGGNNDDDNSGVLKYVRIEFAGYPFEKDKEINGLTLGSIGRGTTIDYVQVSYSNDDSFEWFGGTVNCKHLVAFKGWDDDFDTDNGFSGNVQYALSVRDSRIADTSQSNGFESDNCADGSQVSPYTTATFSNVTFFGPKYVDASFENTTDYINAGSMNPNNGSALGRFQSAMQIRRSSRLNCINSVAVGYPIGLILDGDKGNTVDCAKNGKLHLQNLVFAGMTALGTDNNKKYEDEYYDKGTETYDTTRVSYSHEFFMAQPGNQVMTEAELNLTDAANVGQAYCPGANSPLLSGASFSDITNLFINQVNYIGAFGGSTDNWMSGWTNFDPQNTVY